MAPASADDPWSPGSVVAGKYRIERELAAEATGPVLLATQLTLNRPVTIKRLPIVSTQSIERLNLETAVFGRLKHPNIVEVYDSGSIEGEGLYLVTEYLEGITLDAYLDGTGLPMGSLLSIGLQLGRAVRQAHEQGIVHADLKPSTIFLTDRGMDEGLHVKVVDFGLGVLLANAHEGWEQDRSEYASPVHMAPEQWHGEPVAACTDVYALGIILFQMLAGTPPFMATSRSMFRDMHLRAPPPRALAAMATGLAEVEVVVRRCLAKAPDDRYTHAGELLADLEAVAQLLDLTEPPEPFERAPTEVLPATSITAVVGTPLHSASAEQLLTSDSRGWNAPIVWAVISALAATGLLWWWLLGSSP